MLTLRAGRAVAHLLPDCGARVASLTLAAPQRDAVELLVPYALADVDPSNWPKAGMFPLLPYSNRIGHAALRVGSKTFRLPPHPLAYPHTLHGNGHLQPWQVQANSQNGAVFRLDSPASSSWPWRYRAIIRYALSQAQLQVHVGLCNTDDRPMPAGIGLHPYFRYVPAGEVGYRADCIWPTNTHQLVDPRRALQAGESGAPPRPLPSGSLTRHLSHWDGAATWRCSPDQDAVLQADPLFGHLVVHRPDSPRYLCLEPVSHVANGFNLADSGVAGTGTRMLAPGESMGGRVRIALLHDARAALTPP